MRIISDFDGVFTSQQHEADAVGARQIEVIAEAIGDAMKAHAVIVGLRGEVTASPVTHGWVTDAGISCYADEDPYVFHNAVGAALYERGPEDVVSALKGKGFPSQVEFTSTCFFEGTERWRAANDSHLFPEAVETLNVFASAGLDVAIVSNSSTTRVESILAEMGMDRFGAWKPRVRGGAQKFVVTPSRPDHLPETATFGEREIRVRRGHYYDILKEEQPELVIGDVLSLDVVLPLIVREQETWLDDVILCLKRAPHTPQWAVDAAIARGVHVVDSINEVPGILGI